jgi:protein-disulfide isomerase
MAKSRQSTRKRAAQRRARQRRQRQLAVLLIVAAVAILVTALLILASQRSAISAPEVSDYSSYPQGIEEDGSPYIGNPDAPAVLVEYGDFACSACGHFADTAHQLIEAYVADGSLKIVYTPMSFIDPQNSPTAAEASLCAADQDGFWEMHDALFGTLSVYGSQAFTQRNTVDLAAQIGLDEDSFESCMNSGDKRQVTRNMLADARTLGIASTPTLMFNGQLQEPGAMPYNAVEQLILNALP